MALTGKERQVLKKVKALHDHPSTPKGIKDNAKRVIDRLEKKMGDGVKEKDIFDELLEEMGVKREDSIFSTKEAMRKRWAKMAEESKKSKK